MTNILDRRLRKLEAGKPANANRSFRIVLVKAGDRAAAEIAAAAERYPDEELCIVRLVRPREMPPADLVIH